MAECMTMTFDIFKSHKADTSNESSFFAQAHFQRAMALLS
jgi:hypothetical protein